MLGESGKHGWYKIHSDTGLQNYARLLRGYHEAIQGYKPSDRSIWAYVEGGLKPGEIICHGDFGPWNITWQDDVPTGIIDWDLVFPAQTKYDVLYALEWHHFAEVPNRKRRVDVFLEAYGMTITELGDITNGVASLQRSVAGHEKLLAERGMQPQVDWVANGSLAVIEERARWTEANRNLFEST